ncbi:hypothetical protein ACW0JT_18830 [Arthrobacter sp. SA17]
MPSIFNLTISHLKTFRRLLAVSRKREARFAADSASEVNLPAGLLQRPVAALSGGNQQKIVFGRAILRRPRCLLLFDPARGVDAATKMEIYHMTRKYAEDGGAVLMYSTEIPELVGLCDRVYSIYNGKVQKFMSAMTYRMNPSCAQPWVMQCKEPRRERVHCSID